jgi:hypothetical protein
VFARDGVLHLIDGSVYSSEIEHAKPHPEAFAAALRAVDVDDPAQAYGTGTDAVAARRVARPAATDRIATRADVLAGRAVITTLARHHDLLEPKVDAEGTVYVRAGGQGFARLWRFASGVAHTLGEWVNVSDDEGVANRAAAVPS